MKSKTKLGIIWRLKKRATEVENVFIIKPWPPFKCRRNRFLSAGPHRADPPDGVSETVQRVLVVHIALNQPATTLAATVSTSVASAIWEDCIPCMGLAYGLTPLPSKSWRFPRPHSVLGVNTGHNSLAFMDKSFSFFLSRCLLIWKIGGQDSTNF